MRGLRGVWMLGGGNFGLMSKCCQDQQTEFCPHCGRQLFGDPRESLIRYLEGQLKTSKSKREKSDHERSFGPLDRQIKKWERWRDVVKATPPVDQVPKQ